MHQFEELVSHWHMLAITATSVFKLMHFSRSFLSQYICGPCRSLSDSNESTHI